MYLLKVMISRAVAVGVTALLPFFRGYLESVEKYLGHMEKVATEGITRVKLGSKRYSVN